MLNRRYLGWLIAGAYVAPHGPYCRPGAVAAAIAESSRRPPPDAARTMPVGGLPADPLPPPRDHQRHAMALG